MQLLGHSFWLLQEAVILLTHTVSQDSIPTPSTPQSHLFSCPKSLPVAVRGPGPLFCFASTSAPCCSSSATVESWPCHAAQCRAVSPRPRNVASHGCRAEGVRKQKPRLPTAAGQLAKKLNTPRASRNCAIEKAQHARLTDSLFLLDLPKPA